MQEDKLACPPPPPSDAAPWIDNGGGDDGEAALAARMAMKRKNADALVKSFKDSLDGIAKRMKQDADEYETTTAIITDMFSMAVDTKIMMESKAGKEAIAAAKAALAEAALEPVEGDGYEVSLALEAAKQCGEFALALRKDAQFKKKESVDLLRELRHCFAYVAGELDECIKKRAGEEADDAIARALDVAIAPPVEGGPPEGIPS